MSTLTHGADGPLLQTKLHIPRRRRGLVLRPRLADRLRRDELPPLTLVSAPAGFGKTTLLAEWAMSDGEPPTGWISLDARDNDPAVFWAYMVAALQVAAPEVGADALALLRSQAPIDAVVATLLNDLADLAQNVILVLDDYHLIESQDLHEAMAFLLEQLPPQVHLVIGSRADPPLPLGRLRARGDLLELRAPDLRFTAEEAATYLNDSMGLRLSAADVVALEGRTEGWIAALQLAALSMQGRQDVADFIAGFAGDDRFIVDYLADEVLHRQTDGVRAFLLQTSILSRLTAPLCAAVTGQTDAKAMLELLDRANLFLVPLDDRRVWYRYHHLFADVLRARLLDDQPGLLPDLHRRACDWYVSNDDQPEAIRHAMAAGDAARAAELIELAGPALRRARQEATLRRWLEALPGDLFETRPVLMMELVGARMSSGSLDDVGALLDNVERWLARAHDDDADAAAGPMVVANHEEFLRLPAQAAVQRAGLALMEGDITGTMAHANRALDLLAADDGLIQGAASALTGLAEWRLGNLDAARSRYADSVATFVQSGFFADVLGCSVTLADLQIAQGCLTGAMRTFEAGLALAAEHGPLRGTADMHVGVADLLRERNQLDDAVHHLRVSEKLGEHLGLPQNAYRWRVAMARVKQAQGEHAAAIELLEQAERVYNTDFSPDVRPIPAVRARADLARGDISSAAAWVRDRGLTTDDALSYGREYEHVTLARVRLAQHRPGDASAELLDWLDRLLEAAEDGGRVSTAIEIFILQALAHEVQGNTSAALARLRTALERAESEAYVRVFLDEGAAMVGLLRAIARQDDGGHAARLLAAIDERPAAPAGQPLVDDLSSRELDVLRLLRSDLSGPDIARELLVSLNTLRTHTKNIYAKLGVTNRREALTRATELGL